MVGTASHESVQAGTKLLDIPLNPENNMTALWVGERQETFHLQVVAFVFVIQPCTPVSSLFFEAGLSSDYWTTVTKHGRQVIF